MSGTVKDTAIGMKIVRLYSILFCVWDKKKGGELCRPPYLDRKENYERERRLSFFLAKLQQKNEKVNIKVSL